VTEYLNWYIASGASPNLQQTCNIAPQDGLIDLHLSILPKLGFGTVSFGDDLTLTLRGMV